MFHSARPVRTKLATISPPSLSSPQCPPAARTRNISFRRAAKWMTLLVQVLLAVVNSPVVTLLDDCVRLWRQEATTASCNIELHIDDHSVNPPPPRFPLRRILRRKCTPTNDQVQ